MTQLLPIQLCALGLLSLASQERESTTLVTPDGYNVEVIASSPLIHSPRALAWDAFERLWVLETDVQGWLVESSVSTSKEQSTLAYFEDSTGDGALDRRVDFARNLGRADSFCHAYDGVLVATDRQLLWLLDRDKDGRCDLREVVADQPELPFRSELFGTRAHLPEPIRLGIDNWFYVSSHNMRYRMLGGEWQSEPTALLDSFGFAEDEWGRHLFGPRAEQLASHHLPAQSLPTSYHLDPSQDPSDPKPAFVEVDFGWESFSGTRLQASDRSALFSIEMGSGRVSRSHLAEKKGLLSIQSSECFLAPDPDSLPVTALATGPDGALYLCGGRVLRMTHQDVFDARDLYDNRVLGHASSLELCASLGSSNGWRRRTAQRLLIERGLGVGRTKDALLLSLEMLATNGLPLGRLHALWTLEGLGHLTPKLLLKAFQVEREPHLLSVLVRLAADLYTAQSTTPQERDGMMRAFTALSYSELGEELTAAPLGTNPIRLGALDSSGPRPVGRADLTPHETGTSPDLHLVRWQLAASLGEFGAASNGSLPWTEEQLRLARFLLAGRADDGPLADNIANAVLGRELQLFDALGSSALLNPNLASRLARQVETSGVSKGQGRAIAGMAELAIRYGSRAALEGLLDALLLAGHSPDSPFVTAVSFPTGLATALAYEAHPLFEYASPLAPLLVFSTPPIPGVNSFGRLPLRGEELAQFSEQVQRGEKIYDMICAACHMPGGEGLASLGPPLLESDWLEKEDATLADIVLNGLDGSIDVLGKTWDMTMPSWAALSDRQLADCLTFVRATFGKMTVREAAISEETLREVRARR